MMISRIVQERLRANPDMGPTLQSLRHGSVEIKTILKRGPVMARRVGMHERLYARGKLTDAEWNWACRYVKETEIAAGARPGKPEIEPVDVWSGPMIYNRQCAAVGFLRRAHERINAQERLVLIAACVEALVVAELGVLLGLPPREEEDATAYTNRVSGRVNIACARIIKLASAQKNQTDASPAKV